MSSLELKIPPPVLAALVAFAMWSASLGGPTWQASAAVRGALALVLITIGSAFMLAGVTEIVRARTTINPIKPQAASSLVASGVFKITRNPMYVGGTLLLAAWAMHLSSLWSLLGPVAFALYLHRFQVMPEERALSSLFGAEYSAYAARVRRWL